MEIKKVYLENIRSYKEAEVEFPSGSVLLSGDIGSGKSSVLLAVEFALFGLQKGTLSGSSLLRNDAESGKVMVNLEIDNNNVIIERVLKRNKKSVSQESGSITINDEKKEVSTQEMRNSVLKMLNYPQEFLQKNPVLYRYTVYTPQEEMKQILIENADTRLDTIRRVFAVDKYKRVNENVNVFLAKLRESIKNKEGMIADFDAKKEALFQKQGDIKKIEKSLNEINPFLEKAGIFLEERKKELGIIEIKRKEVEKIKTTLAVIITDINSKTKQLAKSKERISEIEKEIRYLSGEDAGKMRLLLSKMSKEIFEKNSNIRRLSQESLELNKKKSVAETKKDSLKKGQTIITGFDICPTCRQKVPAEHKERVVRESIEELTSLEKELRENFNRLGEISKLLEKEENELKILQEKEKDLSKIDVVLMELRKSREEAGRLEIEIDENTLKYDKMKKQLESFGGIEESYEKARKNVDGAIEEQKQVEIKKAQINEQLQSSKNVINELKEEIAKKEGIKLTIEKYGKLRSWLNDKFIPLVGFIEKNVMLNLHQEFNLFFEKWFNMLVASEGLRAWLDENFSPIIEQAGYNLDYAYLSGGERTAAALAYRLALNQVINSLLSHIKTRDLLILDEPTDGFSAEQLDKMRDVLSEVNAKQLILVSHESKIENFVENIIRFEKEGHVSRIA